MTNHRLRIHLAIILLFAAPWLHAQPDADFLYPEDTESAAGRARALFESMTTEQRLAQLFLVGWDNVAPSEALLEWINTRGLGGVKVFGWNTNNAVALARSLSTMQERSLASAAGIPLLTATDQEGGWVRHVRDGTSNTPGNMALGAGGTPADSFETARRLSQELRVLGINMNFAPTVDVYRNTEASVIGPRAFGDDPLQTAILGMAFARGSQAEGVIPTAKHFPGHGNAVGDSHLLLPRLQEDLSELRDVDLLPFRMMIHEGVPAVLSAHIAFPNITGTDTPASLSSFFMRDILRDELDFSGIAVTDDMYMLGAVEYAERQGWTFAEMVVEALAAGNDMVMLSRTPDANGAIWQTLVDRYQSDPEFRDTTNESVMRVLETKVRFLGNPDRVPLNPDVATIRQRLPSADNDSFFAEQAVRGTSIIRRKRIPLSDRDTGRVLVTGNVASFLSEARRWFPEAERYPFPYSPTHTSRAVDRTWMRLNASRFDTIIFGLSNRNSAEILAELEPFADRVVVLSTLSPLYLSEMPWVQDAVAVFGLTTVSHAAGFAAIRGNVTPAGIVPLSALRPPVFGAPE
ncbi:MAG: glycoside hydrolase family 3 protein [Spirochaetaceae bacterium]